MADNNLLNANTDQMIDSLTNRQIDNRQILPINKTIILQWGKIYPSRAWTVYWEISYSDFRAVLYCILYTYNDTYPLDRPVPQ